MRAGICRNGRSLESGIDESVDLYKRLSDNRSGSDLWPRRTAMPSPFPGMLERRGAVVMRVKVA